ncbi:hypothetical protein [Marinitenerispora sediminis]|uniref:hypothetical protein n=1 Tax=Marinitenerispora sediminis TaxID=1931232 RepID=UPI0011C05AE6|nr:hypothetical protein [Marinitenerispora sediminis]
MEITALRWPDAASADNQIFAFAEHLRKQTRHYRALLSTYYKKLPSAAIPLYVFGTSTAIRSAVRGGAEPIRTVSRRPAGRPTGWATNPIRRFF